MGASLAAIIPIFDPLEEFRKVAHSAIDNWIEKFRDFFERDKPPTLSEISERFTQTRHLLMEACFEGLVKRLAEDAIKQEYARCPRCGRLIHVKRVESKAISIMHGTITLERPYFYCRDCRHGFCPMDVQSAILCLAADLPYETAVKHFSSLTGKDISSHFSHETLNAIGESTTLETVIPPADLPAGRQERLRSELMKYQKTVILLYW